jgi:hypothetical protein
VFREKRLQLFHANLKGLELLHEPNKSIRGHGLVFVAYRFIGVTVNLDHNSVRPGSQGSEGHGFYDT